jgi:cell wall-associated NlpC family hydrolase
MRTLAPSRLTTSSRIELLARGLLTLSCISALSLCVASSAAAQVSQGQAIVNAAASQRGVHYCFDGGNKLGPTHGDGDFGEGGCPGSTKGFDCSGLALFAVYQGTGILLPHKASSEAKAGGTPVSRSALEPGDLVFFGGGSLARAVHVGIYAGGGKMWDANNYNVPVQERTLAWEEGGAHGLAFDGAVRYWHATGPSESAPSGGSAGGASPSPVGEAPPAGAGSPSPVGAETPPPPAAPPAPTYAETSGSVVHTWTDYLDAGGSEGPSIPSNDTVQISCKISGFAVADGNTWWYQVASTPWSDAYYASADAFYNDGQTSGSLLGTPFVDPAVRNC